MPESFFTSTIKRQSERGVLCECTHIRGQHRLLDTYVREEEEAASNEERPEILCHCGCVTFQVITNLRYLEILEKESSEAVASIQESGVSAKPQKI